MAVVYEVCGEYNPRRAFAPESRRVTEKELADLAHHEAAHAVVAVALVVPLEKLTIARTGDVAGSMSYPPPTLVDAPDPTPSTRDKLARDMITVCYAGRSADRRRGCEEEYKYEQDDATAWELLVDYVRVGGAGSVGDAVYESLSHVMRRKAESYVTAAWHKVEALARALLERKTMTWQEVLAVVQPDADRK